MGRKFHLGDHEITEAESKSLAEFFIKRMETYQAI